MYYTNNKNENKRNDWMQMSKKKDQPIIIIIIIIIHKQHGMEQNECDFGNDRTTKHVHLFRNNTPNNNQTNRIRGTNRSISINNAIDHDDDGNGSYVAV
jgi:hypothetical protein